MGWDGIERRTNPDCVAHNTMLTDMRNDVKDIKVILTGNGKPMDGLVHQNALNTGHRRWMEKFQWLIVTGLVGITIYLLSGVNARL